MKILIGYVGSECANGALEDLKSAGLPANAEVLVMTGFSSVQKALVELTGCYLAAFRRQSQQEPAVQSRLSEHSGSLREEWV